jgi:hypothetical protein
LFALWSSGLAQNTFLQLDPNITEEHVNCFFNFQMSLMRYEIRSVVSGLSYALRLMAKRNIPPSLGSALCGNNIKIFNYHSYV